MNDNAQWPLFREVSAGYTHVQKFVRPAAPVTLDGLYLKWYVDYPAGRSFSDAEIADAQAMITNEIMHGRLVLGGDIGFVVQHRCGPVDIFYVCVWRNNNEVWEALYHRAHAPGSAFESVPRETLTGTFCVWVIPVVAHEQAAWVRYLTSARDAAARMAYCQDVLNGSVG